MEASDDIGRLIEIMARLRDPATGCAWDLAQSFDSIVPYTLEEAAEVADAIARGDLVDLRDELGDLLFQVVFQARLAEEQGAFAFPDVVHAITAKMIRRHPHVFGDGRTLTADEIKAAWTAIKAREKAERQAQRGAAGDGETARGWLDGIPAGLPGLTRAVRLQQRAGEVGFDWNDPRAVLDKIREEIDEVEQALDAQDTPGLRDEIGDVLFAIANLARHLGVSPDLALARTNAKFQRRFGHIEQSLGKTGKSLADASLAEMEALWQEAKHLEATDSVAGSDI